MTATDPPETSNPTSAPEVTSEPEDPVAQAIADGYVARCKGGSFSDNTDFSGTCSSDGDVDFWLATYGECQDGTVIALGEDASCDDHDGFDGAMLGPAQGDWHVELTHCRTHPVRPRPTPEDLLVLYVPDAGEWRTACDRMLAAGFVAVASFNPYWDGRGRTFEDPDGYRIVMNCNGDGGQTVFQIHLHLLAGAPLGRFGTPG